MSCLPVPLTSASYASALVQAQTAYNESTTLLHHAGRGKTTKGSIAYQIDQLDRQTRQVNETPRDHENFIPVKNQFTQFVADQLNEFETSTIAYQEGLKAIETINNAKARCAIFKLDINQEKSLEHHMKGLGVNMSHYEEKQAEVELRTLQYPFDEQIAELTGTVAKVAAQMRILEIALDRAFFAKKRAEGNKEALSKLYTHYDNPYLIEALAEKDKLDDAISTSVAARNSK